MNAAPEATVWTLGHSTRPIDAFLGVLAAYEIELIADVRRFPGSRRQPQYGGDAFCASLAGVGIAYRWLPALGGRRRPAVDSPNIGWRHPAFRGYADHLASEEFAGGLFESELLARGLRTAIMCAETLWWRCHRRLIADVLTSLGYDVIHIRDERSAEHHRLMPPVRITMGRLTYPEAG